MLLDRQRKLFYEFKILILVNIYLYEILKNKYLRLIRIYYIFNSNSYRYPFVVIHRLIINLFLAIVFRFHVLLSIKIGSKSKFYLLEN